MIHTNLSVSCTKNCSFPSYSAFSVVNDAYKFVTPCCYSIYNSASYLWILDLVFQGMCEPSHTAVYQYLPDGYQ